MYSKTARQLTMWYVWFNTEVCSDNRIAVSSVFGLYYHTVRSAVRTIANSSLYSLLHDTVDRCQLVCTDGIVDQRNVNDKLHCVV
jgi:hypothetical protein